MQCKRCVGAGVLTAHGPYAGSGASVTYEYTCPECEGHGRILDGEEEGAKVAYLGYHGSRQVARVTGTMRLRRQERQLRRVAHRPDSLGSARIARWVAIRDELRYRGKGVPDTTARPNRWWPWS
jgi:hypothetical protein